MPAGGGRRGGVRASFVACVLVAAWFSLLPGTAAPQTRSAGGDDASRKTLIEQKLRLLDTLVQSPRAREIAASGDAESKGLYDRARQLRDEGRSALSQAQFDRAGAALDEALRAISKASSRMARPGAGLGTSAQIETNTDLLDQVRLYRQSIVDATGRSGAGKIPAADIARLDRLTAEAEKQTAAGNHGDANKLLAESYQLAVTMLSRARAGETVFLDLKFASPAEEFAYEQKRNRSHEMLVEMAIAEGRADPPVIRNAVEQLVGESRKQRARADQLASSGNFAAAIKAMEQATGYLVRALQAVGLPVF